MTPYHWTWRGWQEWCRQLAQGFEILTSGSGEGSWQLTEGKLENIGDELQCNPVVLQEAEIGVCINLQDIEGVSLSVEPLGVEITIHHDSPHRVIEEKASLEKLFTRWWSNARDTLNIEVSDMKAILVRGSKGQGTVEAEVCTFDWVWQCPLWQEWEDRTS